MLTFLFWNLKRARADLLASLARAHKVDVLILAECPLQPAAVLTALNQDQAEYCFVPGRCPKLALYTRFPEQYVGARVEGDDYTIRAVSLPGRLDFLLCGVHFPSKRYRTPDDLAAYSVEFASGVLARAEQEAGHTRTLLVGDLNMNPYENGLVLSSGLHAVTTRAIAERRRRRVKFESNTYFYNPMWRHFGERPGGHAGTYYLESPKARADFWNIYDQVLVRPDLLPYFRDEDLEIIHADVGGEVSFLRRGIPDHKNVSDHLPILFRLGV